MNSLFHNILVELDAKNCLNQLRATPGEAHMKCKASDLRSLTARSSTAQYEVVGLFLAVSDSRGDKMKDTTLHYDDTAVVDISY